MGPSECIGSTFQKYNRPKQSNRQQHPPMQWAHPNASAVPHRNLMGPSKVIGSSITNSIGPSECIGSASQKIISQIKTNSSNIHSCKWPILGNWQCLPQI